MNEILYPCNQQNYAKGRTQDVEYLVIHYVGAEGSALDNVKYFSKAATKSSAHYFVDFAPKAEVYQSVDEKDTAWAVGAKSYVHPHCRNSNSISIELCTHKDGDIWSFDPETVEAAIKLSRKIVSDYGIPPENLLRHYDVTGKNCPEPFVRVTPEWEAFKHAVYQETDWHIEFEEAWEDAIKAGVTDGQRPNDSVTRNELIVMMRRLRLF